MTILRWFFLVLLACVVAIVLSYTTNTLVAIAWVLLVMYPLAYFMARWMKRNLS